MKKRDIARICNEVNKVYCETIGDHSQKHWEGMQEKEKISAVKGVEYYFKHNGKISASQMHDEWMREKLIDGWKYGKVKYVENKEHPNLLPYCALPEPQQIKDEIFISICNTFEGLLD